ncbi:hypothetical protein K439DRAFT_1622441 [Ramaria rubella]|nr:hypothetical protein K439DRAFT_1622441 [Ramaria rubella]
MSASAQEGRPGGRPSIYPQPEPELVLVETHSALEQQIAVTRRATNSVYQAARSRVQSIVDRWIGVEHAVERRVKSIIPTDEPLTPGALYVGVATLTASVLARNRLFLRFSLPPALFILSLNHFLPKTSQNISSYLTSLERAHAPSLADAHEQLNQNIFSTSAAARQGWINAQAKATGGMERTVTELQDRTGLKLKETLGWGRGAAENVETEAEDVAKHVERKIEDLRK